MTANPTPYFVTGLPRSRTAWWSVLLSRPGAICDHEGELLHGTNEDYLGLMSAGNSSALLLYYWRKAFEAFPTAKWLILERDPQEALEAAIATCPEMETMIRRGWPVLIEEIEALKMTIPAIQRMSIPQAKMEEYWPVFGAYMHLTGERLALPWFHHMARLNVSVQSYQIDDLTWMQDIMKKQARVSSLPAGTMQNGPFRLFTESDIPMMETWNNAHTGHGITPARIPPLGVVVNGEDGEPAAMLFAQMAVDRPVAYLEDPVSRPGLSVPIVLQHFMEGLGALKASLAALGYDVIVANTTAPFARILKRWGWTQREDGLIKLETATT
jgi:hypothetical protein